MGRILKLVGYGVLSWAIPYVTSLPLLGLLRSDPEWFHTIMIVEGSIAGAVLTVLYFKGLDRDFLRHGLIVATVWLGINWGLDFLALLPFTGMSPTRYFMEIGLRYLALAALAVAVGYGLEQRANDGR